MPGPPAVETLEIPPHDFPPLELAFDDRLSEDIQLVLAYRHDLAPDLFMTAMRRGLLGFPHLTGQAVGESGKVPHRIVPAGRGAVLEVVESGADMTIEDLEALPLDAHASAFMPQGRRSESPAPMFQARLTRLPAAGLSILGLRVSHMAVDGSGLAWFISHCTAALRGVEPCPVFHERRHGFGESPAGPDDPPHRYRPAVSPDDDRPWTGDAVARKSAVIFTVPTEIAHRYFHASSLLDSRLRFGAWLCAGVAARHPAFTELGLWCDPRGTSGIPAGYTGNAGCYLHFPLRGMAVENLTMEIKKTTTREGFQRIADTYRRIKRAEAAGKPLVWDGPGTEILQLNLVPHSVTGTDFGGGVPAFALLLSRNSSGLRISLTPDASQFLVEACLPDGVGDSLVEACHSAGLHPSFWCRGRKLLECLRP